MSRPTAAILGLGLIGGSLARDLHALGTRVLGFDRDAATLRAALEEGTIEAALPPDGAGLEAADVVVFAVPVHATPGLMRLFAPRLRAGLVTDVGSTKRSALAAAVAAGIDRRFVGSHPLAGDHRTGWSASRAGLFEDRPVFLCPAPAADRSVVERAVALWAGVGARPQLDDASDHDRRMAWLSHLPQAAASALALAISQSGLAAASLGPGGRDATRLAASSAELWTGILLDNADAVERALAALEAAVATFRGAVRRGDERELLRLLGAAGEWSRGDAENG